MLVCLPRAGAGLLIVGPVADRDFAHFLVADCLDRVGIGDDEVAVEQVIVRVLAAPRIDHVAYSEVSVVLGGYIVVGMIQRDGLAVQSWRSSVGLKTSSGSDR